MRGQCLCGTIRYSVSAEPDVVAICHCRACQRQSGSAYSVVCVIAADAYVQSGETRFFTAMGDSGWPVHRHFCPGCGSPIISVADAIPGKVIVKSGTLDNIHCLKPIAEVYCDNALSWVDPFPGAVRLGGSDIPRRET